MATVKEIAAQLEASNAAQAEVNTAMLAALQGISAKLDDAPSGVTVEVDTPAPAPAPAKADTKPAKAKREAKPRPSGVPEGANYFVPSAVLKQGWQDAQPGEVRDYARTGKSNPGTSQWSILTTVDADGGIYATKVEA